MCAWMVAFIAAFVEHTLGRDAKACLRQLNKYITAAVQSLRGAAPLPHGVFLRGEIKLQAVESRAFLRVALCCLCGVHDSVTNLIARFTELYFTTMELPMTPATLQRVCLQQRALHAAWQPFAEFSASELAFAKMHAASVHVEESMRRLGSQHWCTTEVRTWYMYKDNCREFLP